MKYIIYGKPNCQFCTRAIIALNSAGLGYVYKLLDEDFTREELLSKFPEAKTFPQIETEDGTYIGGFNELRTQLGKNATQS